MSESAQIDITSLPDNKKFAPKNIPLQDILVLRKKNLSTRQIAKLLSCTHANVVVRLQAVETDPELLKYVKDNFPDLILHEYVRAKKYLTNAKLEKANALELSKIMSFRHSEYRLESGLSTNNIDVGSALLLLTEGRQKLMAKLEQLESKPMESEVNNE